MNHDITKKLNMKFNKLGVSKIECYLETNGVLGNRWHTAAYVNKYSHMPIATDDWHDLKISLLSLLEKTEREINKRKL
ncbi:MAG TPA: hypothetical protein VK982_07345 [Bacteroidales bacterium]|nr:hypothetical protein [Bacteroidales bacterium]